jgi:anti-sigma B factor antagonist
MLEIVQPNDAERALALAGELDLATTPLLLERTLPMLEEDGDVTLVLSDVSFVDSQGVRGFIQIARSLEGRGRLVLAEPSPEVRKLFDIVRVEDFPNIAVEP